MTAVGNNSGKLHKKTGRIFGYYVGIAYITGSFEIVNSIVKPLNAGRAVQNELWMGMR